MIGLKKWFFSTSCAFSSYFQPWPTKHKGKESEECTQWLWSKRLLFVEVSKQCRLRLHSSLRAEIQPGQVLSLLEHTPSVWVFTVRMFLSIPLKGEVISFSLKLEMCWKPDCCFAFILCCCWNSFRRVGEISAGSCVEMLSWKLWAAASSPACLVCSLGTSAVLLAQGLTTMWYCLRISSESTAFSSPVLGVCQAPCHGVRLAPEHSLSFGEISRTPCSL